MILLLTIVVLSILFSCNKKINNNTILDKSSTQTLLGFCTVLILISHFLTYVEINNADLLTYQRINSVIGQSMVVPFFFISGYGIFESYKNNTKTYVSRFIEHRFLKVLIPFVIAIVIYNIYNLTFGYDYDLASILLSFTGWKSIGNSNWFMFATLYLYLSFYLSAKLFDGKKFLVILNTFILSMLYIFIVSKFKDRYFYDTILLFSSGMLFSYFKTRVITLMGNTLSKYSLITILVLALLITVVFRSNMYVYQLLNIILMLIFSVVTIYIEFNQNYLVSLSKYTFSIYIYQRIFFGIVGGINVLSMNSYIYFFISVICTVFFSHFIQKTQKKLAK